MPIIVTRSANCYKLDCHGNIAGQPRHETQMKDTGANFRLNLATESMRVLGRMGLEESEIIDVEVE